MDTAFNDIVYSHEREDSRTASSSDAFLRAVGREFSNADALLAAAKERGYTPSDFLSGVPLPANFPLPIRTSDTFCVKKHTLAQRPYLHAHDFYELLFVQSGTCMQTFRNGSTMQLTKGQMCLLRPGAAHCLAQPKRDDVLLKAVLPRDLFESAAEGISLPEAPVALFTPAAPFAEYLFLRLLKESARPAPFCEVAVRALITLLLSELSRPPEPPVRTLEEYFGTHLKRASLTHFAEICGYTPAYASRLIHKKTGQNFAALLTEHRLKRAAELLATTPLTVEDIASEVGFASPSGFYKQFGAHFGMTPAQYRRALSDEPTADTHRESKRRDPPPRP